MTLYGMKVSKAGDDVKLVTNLNDLVYLSENNTLKLYKWGNLQLTTNGSGNGSASFTHNLNYAPAFFVFRKGTAHYNFLDAGTYANAFFPLGGINLFSDGVIHHAFKAYSDASNVTITCTSGTPNTTFTFRFYILVDLSQTFSNPDNVTHLKDWGIKCSKAGVDVKTAAEYNLTQSSRYKSLQFYPQSVYNLTLNNMDAFFASPVDTYVEQGTYIDITHNLGYAPFFLAFAKIGTVNTILPFYSENSIDLFNYSVEGFADSTKIRLYHWRSSTYANSILYDNWSSETLELKLFVFTENLAGASEL